MYEYTYKNGKWQFHREGGVIESNAVAVIFDQDNSFDTLLKHGSADKIEALFLGDKYDKLVKTGRKLVMVTVPPHCCEILNRCLSISASKWCTRLLNEINDEILVRQNNENSIHPKSM